MAFRILSSAEAGTWREDDVPIIERGVSLHWLCDFVAQLLARVNEPGGWPLSKASELAYTTRPESGAATICLIWKYPQMPFFIVFSVRIRWYRNSYVQ